MIHLEKTEQRKGQQLKSTTKTGIMRRQDDLNSYDRTHDITPDEVRQFERFKNYTDEQVQHLIETIKRYTRFIYNVVSKRQKSGKKIALCIDNQLTKAA